jgi:hypothetical protein
MRNLFVLRGTDCSTDGPSVGIGARVRSYALPKKMYEQCETEEGNLLTLEELDGCRMARGRSKSTVPCN